MSLDSLEKEYAGLIKQCQKRIDHSANMAKAVLNVNVESTWQTALTYLKAADMSLKRQQICQEVLGAIQQIKKDN